MRPAIDSGIVTWDAPVSYWPIFPCPQNSLRKLTRLSFLFLFKLASGKEISQLLPGVSFPGMRPLFKS